MVYVLIPTRNRKELLEKCIDSLIKQTHKDIKIVVINDGSTDGTEELLKTKYPDVRIIKGDGNLWWTGCMIKAVEYTLPQVSDNDYILLQNDDTYMEDSYVSDLVEMSAKTNRMALGTTLKDIDSNKVIYNTHSFKNFLITPYVIDTDREVVDTFTINGRGTIIPVEVFNKVGNFSKIFPHYASDYDFFCRARKKNVKLGVCNYVYTYSTDKKDSFTKTRKNKNNPSIKEFFDIFFNRKSTSNICISTLFIIKNYPIRYKIFALFRIYLYLFKYILVDIIINRIIYLKDRTQH